MPWFGQPTALCSLSGGTPKQNHQRRLPRLRQTDAACTPKSSQPWTRGPLREETAPGLDTQVVSGIEHVLQCLARQRDAVAR